VEELVVLSRLGEVLFVIDLETRRVHIAGIVHEADGAWMAQIVRNVIDAGNGFLRQNHSNSSSLSSSDAKNRTGIGPHPGYANPQ